MIPTKKLFFLSSLLTMFLLFACSPKVTEPTVVETKPDPKPIVKDETLSPCKHWTGSPQKDKAETLHVLYKDRLREKNYEEAMRLWKQVYELAPAADGKRPDHYLDGVTLYGQLIQKETDPTKKEEYINKVLELYDECAKCYEEKASIYIGLKAFALYYKYPEKATDMEKYELFKQSIDADQEKASDFVINPFTSLMIQLYLEKKIEMSEAQKYATLIPKIIAYGKSKATTSKAKDRWALVEGYAPVRLEGLEGVEGFYDCDYYKAKYFPEYKADPENCEVIGNTYGRLKWGKCPDVDAMLTELKPKVDKCFPPPPATVTTIGPRCSDFLREGNYNEALNCYEEKAGKTDDMERKAQYLFVMSKIYYAHLKRYSLARKYALQAAKLKPNWGEPYILIGKLYASSGPLCGPGRGWDSQIVTWAAIDMWTKAKRVDSSVASEANKLIAKYSKYMPSRGDIFQRNLKEGDSFKVPCWIQATTTIRAAKE
ncbi:MAG TPA: hypothetical protein ENI82_05590 [Bacteroidetes bacterium]|nr:hypothetical protein [Bacteroidota bacterium]